MQGYLKEMSIPAEVADERIAGKLLQLDLPEGKMSDRRKAELAVRESEKEKKRAKKAREADCGLAGRRKRATMGKSAVRAVQCVPAFSYTTMRTLNSSPRQLRSRPPRLPPLARLHGRTARPPRHRSSFSAPFRNQRSSIRVTRESRCTRCHIHTPPDIPATSFP